MEGKDNYSKDGEGGYAVAGHALAFGFDKGKILPFLRLASLPVQNIRVLDLLSRQLLLQKHTKRHRPPRLGRHYSGARKITRIPFSLPTQFHRHHRRVQFVLLQILHKSSSHSPLRGQTKPNWVEVGTKIRRRDQKSSS